MKLCRLTSKAYNTNDSKRQINIQTMTSTKNPANSLHTCFSDKHTRTRVNHNFCNILIKLMKFRLLKIYIFLLLPFYQTICNSHTNSSISIIFFYSKNRNLLVSINCTEAMVIPSFNMFQRQKFEGLNPVGNGTFLHICI